MPGQLVYTAEDFPGQEPNDPTPPQAQPDDQNAGQQPVQPAGNAQPQDDFDVEIVDDGINPTPPVENRPLPGPAGAQPAQPSAASSNDLVLDGDHVPEALRGKKLSEAFGMFETLRDLAAQQYNNAGQQQQQQQQQNQPQQFFTEDDFGASGVNPQQFEQKLQNFFQTQAQPFMVSMYQTQAMQAEQAAKGLPYWDLLGDDVKRVMAGARIDLAANPETWRTVHDRLAAQNIPKSWSMRRSAARVRLR